MKKIISIIRFKFLKWIIKNFGVCFFEHKKTRIIELNSTNCVIKCEKCGETWFLR